MALPVAKLFDRRGRADKLRVSNEHAVDDPTRARDLAALRTVIVCSVWPYEQSAMRQYLEDRIASGGGPLEYVEYHGKLHWTFVVHFKRHDDAVNVVCRDNHKLNGHALVVFLYDERNRFVYSGNGTQEPLLKAEHTVKVPPADCEAPYTVLVTGLHVFDVVTIGSIRHAIENLSLEIRPAININLDMDTGIAFVHFQHYEDAERLVMRGQISVRCLSRLGTCISVPLFLYRGPLPDDSNSSHTTTDQRGADRKTSVQTNTAPGAPATARDDFAIETEAVDADNVSFELLPPDTPAAQAKSQAGEIQRQQEARFQTMLDAQTAEFRAILHGQAEEYRTLLEAQINRNDSLRTNLDGMEAKMNAALADFDQVKIHMESSMQSEVRRSSAPMKDLPKKDGSRLKEQILPETHQLLNGMRSDLTDFQAQIRSAFGQQRSESNQFKSEVSQHRSETSQLLNQIRSEVTELRSEFNESQTQHWSDVTKLQCQLNTCVDTIKEQTQASLRMQDRDHKNQHENLREELRELRMEMIALKVQFAQPASQAGQARRQVQNPDQARNAAGLTIENLSDSESTSSRSSSTLIAE